MRKYNEPYFNIFDMLFEYTFNKKQISAINFYMYDRYTEDGMYEMLSIKTHLSQPKFESLQKLVEFYLEPREDIPYSLAVSNPIYDNHLLREAQTGPATLIANDIDAPSLPLKDKEVSNVTALVRQSSVMHSNKSKKQWLT